MSDAAGVLGWYRIWVVGLTPSAKIWVLSDIVRRVLPRGGGFLTCVPDPPADGMPQSVARARDRYSRFAKAAGQAMVGDARAAMQDLVNHVE